MGDSPPVRRWHLGARPPLRREVVLLVGTDSRVGAREGPELRQPVQGLPLRAQRVVRGAGDGGVEGGEGPSRRRAAP
eukprot:1810717-Alexandrium_andersonii.AAC.1